MQDIKPQHMKNSTQNVGCMESTRMCTASASLSACGQEYVEACEVTEGEAIVGGEGGRIIGIQQCQR